MVVNPSWWDADIQQLKQLLDDFNRTGELPDFHNLLFYALPKPQVPELQVDVGLDRPAWRPLEAARILRNLRQRFQPHQGGSNLVERLRIETQPRRRPISNWSRDSLRGDLRKVADIGGYATYSEFQIRAWEVILDALQRRDRGIVLVAPTGGGKTEAFMLPLFYWIRQHVDQGNSSRFVILYPRKALLHDQIFRAFRYAVQAEPQGRIVIGLQFGGIHERREHTLGNSDLFEDRRWFTLLERCPWCDQEVRLKFFDRGPESILRCPQCGNALRVSLSKEDHRRLRPHLLLSTAESLDRMYLDPAFHEYLAALDGIILDEAHIYHGLYGAHIHHLIQRLQRLCSQPLFRAASSATIPDPEGFGERLLGVPVEAVDASGFPLETIGAEVFLFLQAARRGRNTSPLSAMIQTVMAFGHGILTKEERALIFVDSRDIAGRLANQLEDAEQTRELWRFRIDHTRPQIFGFHGNQCPQTSPAKCFQLYLEGECWRGILGEVNCHQNVPTLRQGPMKVQVITGGTVGPRLFHGDVIVGTSAIEVGIDDPSVKATLHYRPPRTVFEFIQRRGRSGRRGGLAWTAIVLGQEPSDHFYLIRRRRLIRGHYRLPLNPNNPVLQQIHHLLEEVRTEMHSSGRGSQAQSIIWAWIIERLQRCRHVRERYPQLMSQRRDIPAWKWLENWIQEGRKAAEREMGVEWELPRMRRQIVSEVALDIFDEMYGVFRGWLEGEISTEELERHLDEAIERIKDQVQELIRANITETDFANLVKAAQVIHRFASQGPEKARRVIRSGRAWHDFFERLGRLADPSSPWTRHIPAEAARAVFQALFLLHEGLEDDVPCEGNPGVYVPDAFFQETRPIQIEVLFRDQNPQTTSESVDKIIHYLAPYRLTYRYGRNGLFALATDFVRSRGEHVTLRPMAEGPRIHHPRDPRRSAIRIRRARVHEVRCDPDDNIGFCPGCFRLHDVDSGPRCSCGGEIRVGRIYAYENYEDSGFEGFASAIPIGRSFDLLERLHAWTLLRGSRVRFVEPNQPERRFFAWLEPPLYYDLQTRGIRWRLEEIVRGDSELQNSPSEALHAAAHVLLKAMAAIVGVREDQLAYAVDGSGLSVLVWERVEGGAGLSEVFAETLQEDPLAVYREMVATVACPVYLAEDRKNWGYNPGERAEETVKKLCQHLSGEFGLPPDDEIVQEIAQEVIAEIAELKRPGSEEETCRQFDGCPVCVHTGSCTQEHPPSRSLAAQLVGSLIQRVPTDKWGQESIPGPVIWANEKRGEYVVLVF